VTVTVDVDLAEVWTRGRGVEDSIVEVGNGLVATSVAKMSNWAPDGL
jgi:hypothetical protein